MPWMYGHAVLPFVPYTRGTPHMAGFSIKSSWCHPYCHVVEQRHESSVIMPASSDTMIPPIRAVSSHWMARSLLHLATGKVDTTSQLLLDHQSKSTYAPFTHTHMTLSKWRVHLSNSSDLKHKMNKIDHTTRKIKYIMCVLLNYQT